MTFEVAHILYSSTSLFHLHDLAGECHLVGLISKRHDIGDRRGTALLVGCRGRTALRTSALMALRLAANDLVEKISAFSIT